MLKCLIINIDGDKEKILNIINKSINDSLISKSPYKNIHLDYINYNILENKKDLGFDFQIIFFKKMDNYPLYLDFKKIDYIPTIYMCDISHMYDKFMKDDMEFIGNLISLKVNLKLSENINEFIQEDSGKIMLTDIERNKNDEITARIYAYVSNVNRYRIFINNINFGTDTWVLGFKNRINDLIKEFVFSKKKLCKTVTSNAIFRSIEFPPEYRQAGLAILNYFNEIVYQKYPDIDVTVRIEQELPVIRLIIETREGSRDVVERALESYGLVISEKLAPDKFLNNPFHVMQLENKLKMIELELHMNQKLNQVIKGQYEERITALETDISHLRRHQDRVPSLDEALRILTSLLSEALIPTKLSQQQFYVLSAEFDKFIDRAQGNDKLLQSVNEIKDLIRCGLTINDQQKLNKSLMDIKQQDPTIYSELIDFFRGAGSGVGGNILTEILKMIGIL